MSRSHSQCCWPSVQDCSRARCRTSRAWTWALTVTTSCLFDRSRQERVYQRENRGPLRSAAPAHPCPEGDQSRGAGESRHLERRPPGGHSLHEQPDARSRSSGPGWRGSDGLQQPRQHRLLRGGWNLAAARAGLQPVRWWRGRQRRHSQRGCSAAPLWHAGSDRQAYRPGTTGSGGDRSRRPGRGCQVPECARGAPRDGICSVPRQQPDDPARQDAGESRFGTAHDRTRAAGPGPDTPSVPRADDRGADRRRVAPGAARGDAVGNVERAGYPDSRNWHLRPDQFLGHSTNP